MSTIFCILVKLLFIVSTSADETIVKTKYGFVKGTFGTSLHGRKFRAFKSIPYAQPPVGDLRLKPPIPPIPWNGTLDVGASPPYCVQTIKGQEDCLYLGVYVPQLSPNDTETTAKLPVMMFIHGGGFSVGGGADYPPDYLMDKNIIYVSINYRLGALGFLGGFEETLPGNFGLKDQSMALRWIHDNIEAFHGNRNDITIFGESAGSVSVSLHAFNPLSEGLFHKAILESGTASSLGLVVNNENARAMTISFAVMTGCLSRQNTVSRFVECFRALPIEEFIKAASKLTAWYPRTVAGGVFLACIERDVPGAALPQAPGENTYVSKNIRYIAGVNSGEGTFLAEYYRRQNLFDEFAANYQRLIPIVMALNVRSLFDQRTEIAEKIKQYYFGSENITNNLASAVALNEMFRDGIFAYSTVETLKQIQAFGMPTYLYLYSYKIDCKYGWGCYDVEYGVNHGDEQIMLFPMGKSTETEAYTYDKFTPREKNISTTLIDYWTNFAIYGNPNGDRAPVWTPYDLNTQQYLHITNDSYIMEENLYEEGYNFWKKLSTTFNLSFQ